MPRFYRVTYQVYYLKHNRDTRKIFQKPLFTTTYILSKEVNVNMNPDLYKPVSSYTYLIWHVGCLQMKWHARSFVEWHPQSSTVQAWISGMGPSRWEETTPVLSTFLADRTGTRRRGGSMVLLRTSCWTKRASSRLSWCRTTFTVRCDVPITRFVFWSNAYTSEGFPPSTCSSVVTINDCIIHVYGFWCGILASLIEPPYSQWDFWIGCMGVQTLCISFTTNSYVNGVVTMDSVRGDTTPAPGIQFDMELQMDYPGECTPKLIIILVQTYIQ